MIGSSLKLALVENIAPLEAPVLSLYLDVNRGNAATFDKAYALRASEAMKALGLDKGYVAAVGEKLRLDFARPEGRTLVIFAGPDLNERFDAYYLQTELPFLAGSDGALAHWGRPLVAPLLFALDQRERHAALYVATDRVRVFEVFLGQVEELSDYVRSVNTDEWVTYRHPGGSHGMGPGTTRRGGNDVDSFKDRLDNATAHLYRSLLPELEKTLEAGRIDRIILLGKADAVSTFEGLLPPLLKARVVGRLPGPANANAAAHEWLPLVTDLVSATELAHEQELLDQIQETGVWGVEETLALLQQNRLHTLVVPWSRLGGAYLTSSGLVAATEAEATVLRPDDTIEEVSLLEVLPELVQRTSTVLEFAEGAAEERLLADFGGMAGIKRW